MMNISPTLKLPWDICSKRVFICGVTGSGKTHTAAVLAEEMLAAGLQVVVIDPQDNWYGIQRNKDGSRRFDIPVLGGEHGDLPLVAQAARAMGENIGRKGTSAIIVLSGLKRDQQRQYVQEFCEGLFDAKTDQRYRTPMHLFIDEADRYCPQRLSKEKEPCFDAVDEIARRGRFRGIGMSLVSQRPAVVNKDCVAMAQCVISMQLVLTHDRKQIGDWIAQNGMDGKEFMKSLPGLKKGEAWVWCPSSAIFARVNIRNRETMDTSSTPEFKPIQRPAFELTLETM